jgi:mannose-6-phosphate isomerase-like protein (cupin superfamily)
MKLLLTVSLLFSTVAFAQTVPLPAGVVYWPGGSPPAGQPQKADLGDHVLSISTHDGKPGVPEAHTAQDDVFFVQSGSSDFQVGGTGIGMHSVSPGEVQGTSIEGATRVHLVAGDVITIPAGMPHQYLTAPGEKIVYFVFKSVKREPVAAPQQAMENLPPGVIHWHKGTPLQGLGYKQNFGDHFIYNTRRDKSGVVEIHEAMDDVLILESGEADFLVGGKGIGIHVTAPGEQQGSTIEGGIRLHVKAGDILGVPAKLPHQFELAPGQQLEYFIIKVIKQPAR